MQTITILRGTAALMAIAVATGPVDAQSAPIAQKDTMSAPDAGSGDEILVTGRLGTVAQKKVDAS